MPKDYITLLEAVPCFLTRPHKNTIVRWATKGVYGVKLKTVRFGGKRLTRRAWVDQFNESVMGASPDSYADVEPSAAAKKAAKKLDKLGIK
jgi:hypothetical protein